MRGGAPRAVWGTTEDDPTTTAAAAAARRLTARGRSPHVVWNPVQGEFVQLQPATEPAEGLRDAAERDSAYEGRVCLQIQVVAHACAPFTGGPLLGAQALLSWLDSWGIPRVWPAGRPGALASSRPVELIERLWSQGGHFGWGQVPGVTGGGPGAICPETLMAHAATVNGSSPAPNTEPSVPRPFSLRPRFRPPQEFGAGTQARVQEDAVVGIPAQA